MDENVDREVEKKIIESPEQLEQQQEAQQPEQQQETREQYRERRINEIKEEYQKYKKEITDDFMAMVNPLYAIGRVGAQYYSGYAKSDKYYKENKDAITSYEEAVKANNGKHVTDPSQQENRQKYDEYMKLQGLATFDAVKTIPLVIGFPMLPAINAWKMIDKSLDFMKFQLKNKEELQGYANEIRQEKMKEQEPEKMQEMEKNEKQNQNQENEMELE